MCEVSEIDVDESVSWRVEVCFESEDTSFVRDVVVLRLEVVDDLHKRKQSLDLVVELLKVAEVQAVHWVAALTDSNDDVTTAVAHFR